MAKYKVINTKDRFDCMSWSVVKKKHGYGHIAEFWSYNDARSFAALKNKQAKKGKKK